MIEVDVFQIFRNHVLRLKFDVRFQFGGFLLGHLNLFHDHGPSRNGGNHLPRLHTVFVDQLAN